MSEEMKSATISQATETSADQRRHERLRVDTKVRYKVINREAAEELGLAEKPALRSDGQVVNISVSGLAIQTEALLRKGDFLKVELSLPGMARATRALAEVMWVRLENGANLAGIRFLILLNEADDNSIRRFIETHGS
jgi:hypothetical protein